MTMNSLPKHTTDDFQPGAHPVEAKKMDIVTKRCSFCGKSDGEVGMLIAGPGVFICNECTRLCTEIVVEWEAKAPVDHAPARLMKALFDGCGTSTMIRAAAGMLQILEDEVARLEAREQELLESCSAQVEARRDIDRNAMVAQQKREIYHQPVESVPRVPSDDEVRFRGRLFVEEGLETLRAMFAESNAETWRFAEVEKRLHQIVNENPVCVDLVELADGSADTKVVVEGMDCSFGIPSHAIFAEVHRSNMSKKGAGKRADGKHEKGPNFKRPEIERILRDHNWDGKDGKRP